MAIRSIEAKAYPKRRRSAGKVISKIDENSLGID